MVMERGLRGKERERKTAQKGLHKKNSCPKPLTRKRTWLIIASFYKHQSSKYEVLEVFSIAGVEAGGLTLLLWGRRPQREQHGLRTP